MPPSLSENYQNQLNKKLESFKESLLQLDCAIRSDEISIFTSPESHFRMRAEFKIWHDGDTAHYAMFERGKPKQPIFLRQFDHASKGINALMPVIIDFVNNTPLVKRKLFQIDFLDTSVGETLVTLIYHKKLEDDWLEAIAPLQGQLGIHIIGRSRKQKLVPTQDFVTEQLDVNGTRYSYQQIENSFTQPNAKVCEKMLGWAVDNSQGIEGDLLELYCGNGNFTIPLAQNFRRVLATEISKPSVYSALHNIKENQAGNIDVVRMSSEEFCQAMDKKRSFTRLKDIDLDSYEFSTVFVDPPRAGLDDDTINMVKRFDHILYISCNPNTLVENLKTITETHEIKAIAAFDQFPFTDHLETGVILQKRS